MQFAWSFRWLNMWAHKSFMFNVFWVVLDSVLHIIWNFEHLFQFQVSFLIIFWILIDYLFGSSSNDLKKKNWFISTFLRSWLSELNLDDPYPYSRYWITDIWNIRIILITGDEDVLSDSLRIRISSVQHIWKWFLFMKFHTGKLFYELF